MSKDFFAFKQFTVDQDACAMKVGTDGILLGAWAAIVGEHFLDIGTGTGLLALMLAQRSLGAQIDALEIDKQASEQARANFLKSPWSNRIHIYNKPIQEFQSGHLYDTIICNPPFFQNSLNGPSRSRNLARHDHGLGLENLYRYVASLLDDSGQYSMIYPHDRWESVCVLAAQNGLFPKTVCHVASYPSKAPNRILLHFTKNEGQYAESHMSIYSRPGMYSQTYKELTEAYYLKDLPH